MFPGIARNPSRHVCGDGPVFLLRRPNRLPVHGCKAGLDAVDVVAPLDRPPGQIDEAIIGGTTGKAACKDRVLGVLALFHLQGEVKGEYAVGLPSSRDDLLLGVSRTDKAG